MAAPFNTKQVGGRKGQPMSSGTVLGSNTPGGARKKSSSRPSVPFNTTKRSAPAKRPNVPFNTGGIHPLAAAVAKHLSTAGVGGQTMQDRDNPAAVAFAQHALARTGAPASYQHAPDPTAAWREWSAKVMNPHPAGYNVGSGYQAPVPAAAGPPGISDTNVLGNTFLANVGVATPGWPAGAPASGAQGATGSQMQFVQQALARLQALNAR